MIPREYAVQCATSTKLHESNSKTAFEERKAFESARRRVQTQFVKNGRTRRSLLYWRYWLLRCAFAVRTMSYVRHEGRGSKSNSSSSSSVLDIFESLNMQSALACFPLRTNVALNLTFDLFPAFVVSEGI